MTKSSELIGFSPDMLAQPQEALRGNVWRYSCELGEQHVDPMALPPISAKYASEKFDQWHSALEESEDPIGIMADWIRNTIHEMPGGIDVARDVDDGGFTRHGVEPKMFTPWVELADGTHVRFSESRTAMHNMMATTKGLDLGGAMRSPVMNGVALEATSNPESTDPRDAVTLAIYEFAKKEDARYPWVSARPGRLFDMTEFVEKPFFVGPLYNGHPNEVHDPEAIDKAVEAGVFTLRQIVDSNPANK